MIWLRGCLGGSTPKSSHQVGCLSQVHCHPNTWNGQSFRYPELFFDSRSLGGVQRAVKASSHHHHFPTAQPRKGLLLQGEENCGAGRRRAMAGAFWWSGRSSWGLMSLILRRGQYSYSGSRRMDRASLYGPKTVIITRSLFRVGLHHHNKKGCKKLYFLIKMSQEGGRGPFGSHC